LYFYAIIGNCWTEHEFCDLVSHFEFEALESVLLIFFLGFTSKKYDQTDSRRAKKCLPRVTKTVYSLYDHKTVPRHMGCLMELYKSLCHYIIRKFVFFKPSNLLISNQSFSRAIYFSMNVPTAAMYALLIRI
jgi:hypothetical protein